MGALKVGARAQGITRQCVLCDATCGGISRGWNSPAEDEEHALCGVQRDCSMCVSRGRRISNGGDLLPLKRCTRQGMCVYGNGVSCIFCFAPQYSCRSVCDWHLYCFTQDSWQHAEPRTLSGGCASSAVSLLHRTHVCVRVCVCVCVCVYAYHTHAYVCISYTRAHRNTQTHTHTLTLSLSSPLSHSRVAHA